MSGEIISQSFFFIDSSIAGNKQLLRVKSLDGSDDEDLEVVKAVGVQGGAGFRHTTGGGEITLEVFRETNPEVDYRRLKRLKHTFAITIQDEGGVREQYQGCRVANVSRKDDDAGSHMDSVKIKFLRLVPL